jgi:hypothetical protein
MTQKFPVGDLSKLDPENKENDSYFPMLIEINDSSVNELRIIEYSQLPRGISFKVLLTRSELTPLKVLEESRKFLARKLKEQAEWFQED